MDRLLRGGEFPYDIVAKLGKLGMAGCVPEEYGGMGGDYFAICRPWRNAGWSPRFAITLGGRGLARRECPSTVRHREQRQR